MEFKKFKEVNLATSACEWLVLVHKFHYMNLIKKKERFVGNNNWYYIRVIVFVFLFVIRLLRKLIANSDAG